MTMWKMAVHSIFLDFGLPLHSPDEMSIIERPIEYVKDRTEQFDDCSSCRKFDCTLSHVHNWIQLFVFMHSGIRRSHLKFCLLLYLVEVIIVINLELPALTHLLHGTAIVFLIIFLPCKTSTSADSPHEQLKLQLK